MLPNNISLIRYDGVKKATNGVYVGGFRYDVAKSYVCGFIDKTHAAAVSRKIVFEPIKVVYSERSGMYYMDINAGRTGRQDLINKPIMRRKIKVVTMETEELLFFTKVNNTEVVLIDKVFENNGIIAMKSSYKFDFEIDEVLVVDQISARFKTGAYDYLSTLKALGDLDAIRVEFGEESDDEDGSFI